MSYLQYYVPMILNQSGSLLFFLSLRTLDVSVAVPVANGTTFIVTAAVAFALGEQIEPIITTLGVLVTILGICLCV